MDLRSESTDAGADVDCGIQTNGTCKNNDHGDSDANLLGLNRGVTNKSDLLSGNHSLTPTDPPPPATSKGFGLKKWRRIRRNDHVIKGKELEMEKENSDSDSTSRVLKRGSANIMNENENENERGSSNQNENERGSSNENERGSSNHPSVIPNLINSNNEFVIGANKPSTFNAGADSDNSEDSHGHGHSHRSSSKSSTAASAPKYTLKSSASRDKHRLTAKNFNNRSHQQGKSQSQSQPLADPSKKPRGGSLDRESSPLSSLDSDSRSSQLPTPNPLSFDGDDASHSLPPPPTQTTPTENASLSPGSSDQLSSTANHGKLPNDCDPLVNSILMLQSAQLALQKEVQKFGEIGKGISSLCDDSDKISDVPVLSMSVDPVFCMGGSDCLTEFNHAYLSKIVQTLERQLNEAQGSLKEKELRIAELETTKRNLESPQDGARSAGEHQYKICTELEAELQDFFKQKLEAEVQSVVLTRSTKDSSVLIEDWIKLIREQKLGSREQAQSPRMMVDVETKVDIKQEQGERVDTLNTGIVDREEILKVQRGVVKLSKCLSVQLVLLIFVFTLLISQFGPKSAVVVPT